MSRKVGAVDGGGELRTWCNRCDRYHDSGEHTPPVTHIEARHWRSPSMGEEWTLTAHFREGLLGSIVAGGTSLELAQRRLSKRDAWPGPSAASYRGNPLGWLRALEALGITHSVVRVARKADLL